jgi:hydroxymethylpyrimidine pyrophosphatase-like HAD family hydrolase
MKIAVDFDGTIVEHRYPEIGKPMLFAFETLRELQKQQHDLILWTYRAGKELDDAVAYCEQNGIVFYAVNKNFPEEEFDEETISRKINAEVYIDDRNVGGFLGWSKIWEMLNQGGLLDQQEELKFVKEQMGQEPLWKRIFGSK